MNCRDLSCCQWCERCQYAFNEHIDDKRGGHELMGLQLNYVHGVRKCCRGGAGSVDEDAPGEF